MARTIFKTLAEYEGVRTYRNTEFAVWYALANSEFERLGHSAPDADHAREAYAMGESPETFAAYVVNS